VQDKLRRETSSPRKRKKENKEEKERKELRFFRMVLIHEEGEEAYTSSKNVSMCSLS
jgi:hypothetical protein